MSADSYLMSFNTSDVSVELENEYIDDNWKFCFNTSDVSVEFFIFF